MRETGVPEERARQIGRQQALFREVNDRIDELAGPFDLRDGVPILCECAIPDCNERIVLTQAEYESLRRVPTHFAVVSGHDIPAVERIVEQNERYVVVEKIGESASEATNLDPRPHPR